MPSLRFFFKYMLQLHSIYRYFTCIGLAILLETAILSCIKSYPFASKQTLSLCSTAKFMNDLLQAFATMCILEMESLFRAINVSFTLTRLSHQSDNIIAFIYFHHLSELVPIQCIYLNTLRKYFHQLHA